MSPNLVLIRARLEGAAQVKAGLAGIGDSAMMAGMKVTDWSKRQESSMKKLSARAKKMRSVGKSMTYGLTLPIIGVGLAAIKTAADFDQKMAQVGVATDTSGKKLNTLRGLAIKMGQDTSFSAGQSAEAMLELAKSGIKPAQIEAGALKSTMSLAATEGLALGRTAEIVGASMNTFGIKAGETQIIADALAGGANASSASVGGLAESLSQGGQSAAMYNVNIHETVGALAAFAQNGIQASDAGTSFKTFMMRLNPVAKKQKELMNELGLSFFDSHGKMVGLTEVSKRLRGALDGMSQKQRTAALQVLFGSDAMRAANVIYKEGPKGLQKYIKATEKKGNADKMAQARMKGLPGAIEKFKGSIETAAIKLGNTLAPMIVDVAGFIENLANKFTELSPKTRKYIMIAMLVAAALGPLIFILGALASAIVGIVTVVGMVGTAFTFLAANPIVLVLAAIAIAFILLYTKVKWFRDGVNAVIGFIKDNWKTLLPILISPVGAAILYIITHWKQVKHFIAGVVSTILGFLKAHWPLIVAIMAGPLGILVLMVIRNFDKIKGAASSAAQWVIGKLEQFVGWVKTVPGKLSNAGKGAFDWLKNAFKDAINWVIRGWNNLEFKLPGFDPPGPGPKFGGLTIGVPNIPELAAGGEIVTAGWSIVGDAGPELRWMPKGAGVRPLSSPNVRIPDRIDVGREDEQGWAWQREVVVPVELKLDGKTIAKSTARHSESKKVRE